MSLPPGLAPPAKRAKKEEIQCPYLDTINRHLLDFDFEKVCSQSLSTKCLFLFGMWQVFQGRGPEDARVYARDVMWPPHVCPFRYM